MYQILIAEFKHETNTFISEHTDMESYRKRILLEGTEGLDSYRGAEVEVGGFLKVLEARNDVKCIPTVFADATPGGKVEQEVADYIWEQIQKCINLYSEIDGILLSMHGAMVTTDTEDGEGQLLARIRKKVGDKLPIVATLDLHANITRTMAKHATVLLPYDYYPHTDMYQKGMQAAEILMNILDGKIKPVMYNVPVGMIFPIIATNEPVVADLIAYGKSYEKKENIISVNIAHGFCCADINEVGATVTVIGDNNLELSTRVGEKVKKYIAERKHLIHRKFYTVEDALKKIDEKENGFVVFADVEDNPGGGSIGDGTNLLRKLLEYQIKDVALASIYDPAAVECALRAGIGSYVDISIGGKYSPEIMGQPLKAKAYVKSFCDGYYKNSGEMGKGEVVTTGKTTVLVIDGIEVIVCSKRLQPRDIQIFYSNGIDPKQKKILVVKSSVHYRASFEKEALACYDIIIPGMMPQRPEEISYKNADRKLYPITGE